MYKQLFSNEKLQTYKVIPKVMGKSQDFKDFKNYYLKNPYLLVLPKDKVIDEAFKMAKNNSFELYLHKAGPIYDIKDSMNYYPKDLFYKKYPINFVESIIVDDISINLNDFDFYKDLKNEFMEKGLISYSANWVVYNTNIKNIKKLKEFKEKNSTVLKLKN